VPDAFQITADENGRSASGPLAYFVTVL
jgi:hypothetical protein